MIPQTSSEARVTVASRREPVNLNARGKAEVLLSIPGLLRPPRPIVRRYGRCRHSPGDVTQGEALTIHDPIAIVSRNAVVYIQLMSI